MKFKVSIKRPSMGSRTTGIPKPKGMIKKASQTPPKMPKFKKY